MKNQVVRLVENGKAWFIPLDKILYAYETVSAEGHPIFRLQMPNGIVWFSDECAGPLKRALRRGTVKSKKRNRNGSSSNQKVRNPAEKALGGDNGAG